MREDNVQLVTEILDSLNNLPEEDVAAAELVKILQEPHFKVSLNSFLSHSALNGAELTTELSSDQSSLCHICAGMDVGAFFSNISLTL